MSRGNSTFVEDLNYKDRFIEVCGTSKPAEIARLLNVSYQAARNYLEGRMPGTQVLCVIAENTPYSIHWLLTGEGNKYPGIGNEEVLAAVIKAEKKFFARFGKNEDTPLLTGEMRDFIREVCSEVIKNIPAREETNGQTKTVVLPPGKIKQEKILEVEPETVSELDE